MVLQLFILIKEASSWSREVPMRIIYPAKMIHHSTIRLRVQNSILVVLLVMDVTSPKPLRKKTVGKAFRDL